jgi:hypothetical protein
MADSAQIFLEISRDGGCTWEAAKSRYLTVADKTRHRIIWRRNGRFDATAVFRFSVTEPVQIGIGQLTAEIIGGQ